MVDEHDGLTILYGPNGLNKAESENMKFDFAIFDIGSVKEWNDVLNVGRLQIHLQYNKPQYAKGEVSRK